MITCPSCQRGNRADARFCSACGQSLTSPVAPPVAPTVSPPPPRPPDLQRESSSAQLPHYPAPSAPEAPGRGTSPPREAAISKRAASTAEARWLFVAAVAAAIGLVAYARFARPDTVGDPPVVTDGRAADDRDGGAIGDTVRKLATEHPIALPTLDRPQLSDADEIAIGEEVARQIEAETGVIDDAAARAQIDAIGQAVAKVSDRPGLGYRFRILNDRSVNALAVPGGFIYVTRGMISFATSDDELAMVLGHEVAHVAQRQGAELIETSIAAERALDDVLRRNPDLADLARDERVRVAAKVAGTLGARGWGRRNELEADTFGTVYAHRAGFDPQAGVALFRRMQAAFERDPSNGFEALLQTHPPFDERVARIEETIAREGF